MSLRAAWQRRPSSAVTRLGKRQLLILSARDLLRGARGANRLLVGFVAPSQAAMSGFARAAREISAPLILVRPSGADERGPGEARDDSWFVEAAFRAASDLRFEQPMALLKDAPRAGSPLAEAERVRSEIEAGFTGISIAAQVDQTSAARDAALAAAEACRLDLGVELIPLGGSVAQAVEIARALAARGSAASALRLSGPAELAHDAAILAADLPELSLTSASETAPRELAALGIAQLTAAGPFLRSLHAAAPPGLWDELQLWADERHASLEQAAAHHQRRLREMPDDAQDKLEALCFFEAAELFAQVRARGSGDAIAAHLAAIAEAEARL